ncbi:MAG: nitrogenase-stabilizing/protective protein NifW [Chromatiales bacterium]|jgi:nitrogenase-stabilizing/protective protein|nr:nitrogenase-stabilizing/protective protein NifW [Chromatiales bacterium]MDX9767629.1 nitrogenase-stabilizing/protective protein NifW [Ectothiorhodospiraceae bacterium]
MNANDLDDELEDLVSAEDFLDYFDVPYDPSVVHVNRLHILQRFHDYLSQDAEPQDAQTRHALYRDRLARAYQDFVQSDALTEKVFKVFRMHEPRTTFVPLDQAFVKRD